MHHLGLSFDCYQLTIFSLDWHVTVAVYTDFLKENDIDKTGTEANIPPARSGRRKLFVASLAGAVRGKRVMIPVAAIVALVAVACSSGSPANEPTAIRAQPQATATPADTPGPLVIPTPTARPPLTADDRLGLALMLRLYDFQTGPDIDVIVDIVELGHPGLVAPLIEITGFSFDEGTSIPIGNALSILTGQNLGGGFESQALWFEWMADHPEFEPIAGYDEWKGEFYSEIARGLDSFLYRDVPTRIPLWGVQFGGVGKDGIPSLDSPIFTSPEEATYLDPNERVFGIVVNGEARAYPERIMRVHELSNDVVGGRPIALIY